MQKIEIFFFLFTFYCCSKAQDYFKTEDFAQYLLLNKGVVVKGKDGTDTAANDNNIETFVKYNGTDGWMVVDLGAEYLIFLFVVVPSKCCDGAMDFFKVGLHKTFDASNFEPNELCGQFNNSLMPVTFNTLYCKVPLHRVRYLSLSADVLAIAEFNVFKPKKETYDLQYNGCYGKFGEGESVKVVNMTECLFFCISKQKDYAGVTKGGDCLCDSVVGWNMLPSSQCNMACSKDNYFCGGSDSFSVYKTLECKQNIPCGVHCFNETIDTDENCGNGCEMGWKGKGCNIRDCLVNNGGCEIHTCTAFNTGASDLTECVCKKGYERTQIFSNPCIKNKCFAKPCDEAVSTCNLTKDSFECNCLPGYQNKMGSCEDVDECMQKPCKGLEECQNSLGSYFCECKKPNIKVGETCQEDKCLSKPCSESTSTCRNTEGSYECDCKTGFVKESGVCKDKCNPNPCDEKTSTCRKTEKNYECECKSGFVKKGENICESVLEKPSAANSVFAGFVFYFSSLLVLAFLNF